MLLKRLALVGTSLVLVGGMSAACGDDKKDDDNKADQKSSEASSPDADESESTDGESEGTDGESEGTDGTDGTDGSDAPVDAETKAFCEAVIKAGTAEGGSDFKAMQTAWAELYAIGAPSDITPEQAEGFKWYHDVLTKNATQDEARAAATADPDGMAKFNTFKTYVGEKCQSFA